MPFRVSILDITAAVLVVIVIALPARSMRIQPAYESDGETLREIALEQARLAVDPGDARAAAALSELLTDRGQTDWAVQVAAEAVSSAGDDAWRALLAASIAHAERIEIRPAEKYALRALDACRKLGADVCPVHHEVRMAVYHGQLAAGVESGIDPRVAPQRYYDAVLRSIPVIRVRTGTPDPGGATPEPEGNPGGRGEGSQSGTE